MKFIQGNSVSTLAVCALSLVLGCRDVEGAGWGRFVGNEGQPVTKWCGDHHKMELVEDFQYVDRNGTVWTASKGIVVDGATIPGVLWSLVGSPFVGPQRNASIVHDVGCYERTAPSDDVHRMFYEACRCAGMSEVKAKLFYAAVHFFGPSWQLPADPEPAASCGCSMHEPDPPMMEQSLIMYKRVAVLGFGAVGAGALTKGAPPIEEEEELRLQKERRRFNALKEFIERENPSLAEIENYQFTE